MIYPFAVAVGIRSDMVFVFHSKAAFLLEERVYKRERLENSFLHPKFPGL